MLSLLTHAPKTQNVFRVLLPRASALAPLLGKRGISFKELDGVEDTSFSFSSVFRFYRYFKKHPPDAIVTHACISARIAGRLCGVPLLVAVKHCAQGKRLGSLYRFFTDHTVAVSQNAKDFLLRQGVRDSDITVIENGFEHFSPPTKEQKAAARRTVGVADGEIAIGLSGRLSAVKGHKTAISALKKAARYAPDLSLWFLGDGEERTALMDYAEALGVKNNVHFLGFCEEREPFYHALDAHISCSLDSETASLSLAEGMSAALPTLASDIPGNRERVKDGALLFPHGDACALARLFIRLAEDEMRRTLSRSALKRAKELPSEKESAHCFCTLLDMLLKKRLHF